MQLLQVFRLRNRATEVVNEDSSRAIGLQQRAQEPLQEGDELLVLLGLAHLGEQEREAKSGRRARRNNVLTEELPRENRNLRRWPPTDCHYTGAAYGSVCTGSLLKTTAGFKMHSLL